jgi:hypothetical protein
MALAHEPKYVLRLSELPKVVESDKALYPVFMTARDAARLFAVSTETLIGWEKWGLPILRFGKGPAQKVFIEVAAFNDWIRENSKPRRTSR